MKGALNPIFTFLTLFKHQTFFFKIVTNKLIEIKGIMCFHYVFDLRFICSIYIYQHLKKIIMRKQK